MQYRHIVGPRFAEGSGDLLDEIIQTVPSSPDKCSGACAGAGSGLPPIPQQHVIQQQAGAQLALDPRFHAQLPPAPCFHAQLPPVLYTPCGSPKRRSPCHAFKKNACQADDCTADLGPLKHSLQRSHICEVTIIGAGCKEAATEPWLAETLLVHAPTKPSARPVIAGAPPSGLLHSGRRAHPVLPAVQAGTCAGRI